jgi:carbon storage regulator
MLLALAHGQPRRLPCRQRGRCTEMLVLTRKSNQSIMIGDDIEVSVLSVMGEKVRIGIQAPQRIPVFRKEIYLEIHRDDAAVPAEQDGHAGESGQTVRESLEKLGDG